MTFTWPILEYIDPECRKTPLSILTLHAGSKEKNASSKNWHSKKTHPRETFLKDLLVKVQVCRLLKKPPP